MAEPHNIPHLNITTQTSGEPVTIDGREYHLTAFDDLSPAQRYRLHRASQEAVALQRRDDLNETDLIRLDELAIWQFEQIAGDIPPGVREALPLGERERAVYHYFLAFAAHVTSRASAEKNQTILDVGERTPSPN